MIKSNRQLQHLDLSRCLISSESVADVVEVMSGDSLQTLNLFFNELNSEGITNLSFGLMVYTQLVELDVGFNDIGVLGLTYLAEVLTYCILLEVLNLKGNNITFEGVHALIDIMENCNFLQKLDVSINPIVWMVEVF